MYFQNAFVLIYLIFTFTSLVDLSAKVTDVAGVTHRIAQLIERLNVIGDFWNDLFPQNDDILTASTFKLYSDRDKNRRKSVYEKSISLKKDDDHSVLPAWTLSNIWLTPPCTEEYLIKNLSLKINVGESILVVGSSSAGRLRNESRVVQ